jgi:hypothetical protein
VSESARANFSRSFIASVGRCRGGCQMSRRFAWLGLYLLVLTQSAEGYPGASDPKRWPNSEITYNIDPLSFQVGSEREAQVTTALAAWQGATFVGTSFTAYKFDQPYNVSADDNNDSKNTVGFVSTIGSVLVGAITHWRAPRKLPRQGDRSKAYSRIDVGLGKNVSGGTRPRLSWGRSVL